MKKILLQKKERTLSGSKTIFCLSVLIPIFALFTFLRFIPIIRTFIMSFRSWNLLTPYKPWVGINNFLALAESPQFREAFFNTSIYTILYAPSILLLSFVLALTINNALIKKQIPIYQFVYFVPVVCSMVPTAVIWRWIYDPQFGLLNFIITSFGFRARAWLIEENLALISIVIFSVWKQVGYYMVVFFVGLKAIPATFYEAASIDGANRKQILLRIVLPQLKPITLLVLVMATIQSYQVFTQVLILTTTETDMGRSIRVLVYEIYQNAFRFYKMGYASAQAVVLFLIIGIIALIQFRLFKSN